ncbi:condensin complex subunit 2-like [Planococcus citri]|uniref:condensin complex subunit 2-like n=1 Tax=Planococcus citri TaxID=170843 RepID=UPI0031F88611
MDPSSPIVERRSRRIGPVDNTDGNIPPEELNDDEEERSRNRKQLENEVRHHSIHEKRMSASEKSLSEHFHSCIQLAAENKINAKNAFNFKLIDLLHTMLSKKKQIHDFTEVTYSLDAGVKIYSYRVDNVHSDTMKMATSICAAANKNKGDAENETNDADENATLDDIAKKKKLSRKAHKNVRANDVDQINRKASDDQFGISCGLLNNEDYITSSATFDSTKMCLHLGTDTNFWKHNYNPKATPSTNEVTIEFPDLEDEIICPSFENITFKGETNYHDISLKEKLTHEYDFEPPTHEPADDDIFDDETVAPYATNEANLINVDEIHTSDRQSVASDTTCLSRVISSSNFASDLSRLIASETSEYCYFNTQLLKNKWSLKSMGHWNPFNKKRETISKPRTQKKDLIDFFGHNDFKVFEDEAKMPVTVTYAANSDKFLITPITHFNFKEFFRLKTCREMFVVPKPSNDEQPSDLDETINDYNYNNPNDSQHFIPEQYEDDYIENFDEGAVQDVHEAIDRSVLQGDNLLEIPNKVAKIQLPYMVKDKSVDMKELKSKIWQKIETTEKEKTEEQHHDQLQFSDICQEIITDAKSELSVPLLFNAILQLANDRNLQFDALESSLSNFFIRVANVESH